MYYHSTLIHLFVISFCFYEIACRAMKLRIWIPRSGKGTEKIVSQHRGYLLALGLT